MMIETLKAMLRNNNIEYNSEGKQGDMEYFFINRYNTHITIFQIEGILTVKVEVNRDEEGYETVGNKNYKQQKLVCNAYHYIRKYLGGLA